MRKEGLVLGIVIAALSGGAARADGPAIVAWTTFMHAAPGEAGQVIDEVWRGSTVQVLRCAGEWCAVVAGRGVGYLRADILRAPAGAVLPRVPGEDCFTAGQTAYHGLYPERFCHTTVQR